MYEASDDKRPQEQRPERWLQAKIKSIYAAGEPQGRLRSGRRVFPCGFPHHVEDLGPSHHFSRIPTAGGAASTVAALPRIVTAGGGG
jgi:hypothetical protein